MKAVRNFLEFTSAKVILLLGLIATLSVAYLSYNEAKTSVENAFETKARIARNALQKQIEKHIESVSEVSAFIKASEEVSQKDFQEFLNLALTSRDAIKSVYTVDVVPHDKLNQWSTDFTLRNWETHGEVYPYTLDDNYARTSVARVPVHMLLSLKWNNGDMKLESGYDYLGAAGIKEYIQNDFFDGRLFVTYMQNERVWGQIDNLYWTMGAGIKTADLTGKENVTNIVVLLLDVEKFMASVLKELNFDDLILVMGQTQSEALKIVPQVGPFLSPAAPAVQFQLGKGMKTLPAYVADKPMQFESLMLLGNSTVPYNFSPVPGQFTPNYLMVYLVMLTGTITTLVLMRSQNNILRTNQIIEEEVQNKTGDLVTAYNNLEAQQKELTSLNRELEKAMAAATAANKAKSQFLANMSHELRTPLNSIIGYSEILREDAEAGGNYLSLDDHDKVLDAGRHLLALINDVLDLSRIEADRMNLIIDEINVSDLVQSVAATVKTLFTKNNNYFSYDCSPKLKIMHSDEQRLRQILFNLLSNAAKFTAEGSVRLMVDHKQIQDIEAISFSIQDSGIGMTEDQMEHVFDAFTQADSSTSRRYGGTGLGLAISKEFANLLGGEITVDSQLGMGSRFTLILPINFTSSKEGTDGGSFFVSKANKSASSDDVHEPATSAVGVSLPKEASGEPVQQAPADNVTVLPIEKKVQNSEARQKYIEDKFDALMHNSNDEGPTKILIIDDEASARDLTKRHLQGRNVEILEAENGMEGLVVAKENKPSLIILDIMMPEMTGWEVLEKLQADPELTHIPVVICTMVDEAKKGYVLGAADFVRKPVDREDILFRISRCLKAQSADGKPILVVEDDPNIQQLMQRMLSREGYDSVMAGNGYEALAVMDNITPSLILLDLMMPDMDGFTFLEEMRKREEWADIPVIVVTAKELSTEDRMRLDSHVTTILRKAQYSKNQLMQQVEDLASKAVQELKGNN